MRFRITSENCNLLSTGEFVMYCSRVCYMCYMTVSCCLFFLAFFSFIFFFFFFCVLFVNVLKISILPSLCPKNFFFFFFFLFLSLQNFSYGNFSAFQTYVSSQHFFIFFELSSYFIYLGTFSTIFILFCNQ